MSFATSLRPWESLDPEGKRRLKTAAARSSPAGLAAVASRGAWKLAPHLRLLNDHLLAVEAGECRRLAIFMPPRHGKSELTSRYFPSWFLGRNPGKRLLLASYEHDFASQWGRKIRDLVEDKGPAYFGVNVRQDSRAADRWEIKDHAGGMQCAGIGGPLTGKGAHVLLIDDPVKDAQEANSETIRDRNWDWYRSAAYTRLEPGGAIILIQTRWHEDDLAGRTLNHAKETGERWTILNLPALAEPGDLLGRDEGAALWPERYDREALLGIKRDVGSYFWSALYQQRPQPAEGGTFKRSWFRYWQPDGELYLLTGRPVAKKHCRRFGTVDLAYKEKQEADYTVIAAWAVTPKQELILLDVHRERMEGPKLVPAIKRMVERFDLSYVGIEEVAAQALVIQQARKDKLTVKALRADTDKVSRAIPASVRCEAGQVYFPESAPWLDAFEAELLGFPKATHDDQVDVLAYAAIEVQRFGGAAEPESYQELREYQEKEAAAEFFSRASNPIFWQGDDDE